MTIVRICAAFLAPFLTGLPSAASPQEAVTQQSEQIVVTGSRLGLSAEQSVQELLIYDRTRIEQSGQSTVADFLATIPQVSLNSVESTYIATSVRLRGAVEGSTLILINGHRINPVTGGAAPFGFFDLGMIPISLIDRVEVLPNGSSAVYGGDALSGVINIVLRSDFSGVEGMAGYKLANHTNERVAYAGARWKGDSASASMMLTYDGRNPLPGRDRAITASPDYRRFGGPNLGTPFFGTPSTIYSLSGNLPGLNSSFAAVPHGSPGVGLTPSSFAATAGTANTGSYTFYQDALAQSDRGALLVNGSYRIANDMELFTEVLATKYEDGIKNTPPFLQFAQVPPSNPFNPFGSTVRAAGVVRGAEGLAKLVFREEFFRPLVGARGNLGTWKWEVTLSDSRDVGSFAIYGLADTAALNAALASPDRSTALNPFIDGPMGSPALLSSIYSNTYYSAFTGDARIVNGFMRGPVLQLPAGPLDAVAGAEFERNTLDRGFGAGQNAAALFTELRAPLYSVPTANAARREVLALQAAARDDRYTNFGSKTTWQAGLEFRPIDSALLRATHATAFKPPTLYDLYAPTTTNPIAVTDPRLNNQAVVVQAIQGGSTSLSPTTGDTSTVGFAWSPSEVRNLNLSLTWWTLHIADSIKLPSPQYIIDNESLYPGRVVRGPATPGQVGQIVSVDGSYVNYGTMHESGIDLGADWMLRTPIGQFTPALAATYMTKFDGISAPGGPNVNRLSRANNDGIFAPRWKGSASTGWNPGHGVQLSVTGRYIGRYTDYTAPRTIGDLWYLDSALEVGLEPALVRPKGSLGQLKLLVTGTNLANRLPPYSTYFRGYDPYNYDIVGRTVFFRLQMRS